MISYRVITAGGAVSASVHAGIPPSPRDHAPPPPRTLHHPLHETMHPPRCRACWEIRYASYWNAILFEFEFNNRLGLRKYKAVHSGLYSHWSVGGFAQFNLQLLSPFFLLFLFFSFLFFLNERNYLVVILVIPNIALWFSPSPVRGYFRLERRFFSSLDTTLKSIDSRSAHDGPLPSAAILFFENIPDPTKEVLLFIVERTYLFLLDDVRYGKGHVSVARSEGQSGFQLRKPHRHYYKT